jgi:hypothetical protein
MNFNLSKINFSALLMMLMALFFSMTLTAQAPTLEDLPNKFKREYKKDQREAEKEAKRLEREGWDITPDPIEVAIPLPKSYFDPGSLQIISWQTQLQRVAELENRIKAECTFPVHFKISDSGVDQTHPDLQQGFGLSSIGQAKDTTPAHMVRTFVVTFYNLCTRLLRRGLLPTTIRKAFVHPVAVLLRGLLICSLIS